MNAVPEHRLVAEQVALLYRQAAVVFIGSGISAFILVWLLWDEPTARRHLLAWLTAVLGIMALRWIGLHRYRADPERMARGAFWGWVFTFGAAASGASWGYLGWSFFQPTLFFLFPIALMLAGQTALSVPTVGLFFPAHLAFNLCCMTPFMLRNFLEEGRLFLGQSFAILVFMTACLLFARRQQLTIRESIRLRFANLELLERLTQENARAEAARRQAEEASDAKTRFLAAASHDLRQPLQAMTLFAHGIAEDARDERIPRPALVRNLQSACESLGTLLDSLLDLSRAEAGALKADIQDVPLRPLFERIRREFADQAVGLGLRLGVTMPRCSVRSDPVLLERILRNLVANALRYTERGSVLVACRRRGDRLRIEVRDSGIGIPADRLADIFREFHQLGNPERDRRKGLGLGLAIVKALAQQLGHDIDVRSQPGQGSTFAVELREARGEPAAPPIAPQLPDRLRGRLLVIIDDEIMIREALFGLMAGWGCEVIAGENADEILAQLGDRKPAAIIADWRLRDGRLGSGEIAALRTHFGCVIPALLVTGDTAPDAAREANLPVIRKPVQGFRLRAELDALLAQTD